MVQVDDSVQQQDDTERQGAECQGDALPQDDSAPQEAGRERNELRTILIVIYSLNLLALLAFIIPPAVVTPILAVVLAYFGRGAARGTLWENHFAFAIRGFWAWLIVLSISLLLLSAFVGLIGLALLPLWWLMRCVGALQRALERKPIVDPDAWVV
ncbi:DUF4870 family protein [Rhodocista pekingensis]|uniref:DUF4870 family protein n=1 Tax=Rhodocista pekingensis TaxID=201185 RepID=A0ABW2KT63_9PROT